MIKTVADRLPDFLFLYQTKLPPTENNSGPLRFRYGRFHCINWFSANMPPEEIYILQIHSFITRPFVF